MRDDDNEDRALVVGVARQEAEPALVVVRQRSREAKAELGLVRPLREGRPIHGEVVTLKPRPGTPAVCDVEVQVAPPPAALAAPAVKGPAKVTTDRYRDGWDRVFAKPN